MRRPALDRLPRGLVGKASAAATEGPRIPRLLKPCARQSLAAVDLPTWLSPTFDRFMLRRYRCASNQKRIRHCTGLGDLTVCRHAVTAVRLICALDLKAASLLPTPPIITRWVASSLEVSS